MKKELYKGFRTFLEKNRISKFLFLKIQRKNGFRKFTFSRGSYMLSPVRIHLNWKDFKCLDTNHIEPMKLSVFIFKMMPHTLYEVSNLKDDGNVCIS